MEPEIVLTKILTGTSVGKRSERRQRHPREGGVARAAAGLDVDLRKTHSFRPRAGYRRCTG